MGMTGITGGQPALPRTSSSFGDRGNIPLMSGLPGARPGVENWYICTEWPRLVLDIIGKACNIQTRLQTNVLP